MVGKRVGGLDLSRFRARSGWAGRMIAGESVQAVWNHILPVRSRSGFLAMRRVTQVRQKGKPELTAFAFHDFASCRYARTWAISFALPLPSCSS